MRNLFLCYTDKQHRKLIYDLRIKEERWSGGEGYGRK